MVNRLQSSLLYPSSSILSNTDDTTGQNRNKKPFAETAEDKVTFTVPTALSASAHGPSCGHCMQDFIGQKVMQAKPGEVASLKSSAAGQAFGKARENMKAETLRHEMAHYNTAARFGLNPSAPVVNEDGSGHVNIQMPSLNDPNAKTKLQGAILAALAPDKPSSQDQSVAAKAQGMLAQLGGKDSLAADKNKVGPTQKVSQSIDAVARNPYPISSLAI